MHRKFISNMQGDAEGQVTNDWIPSADAGVPKALRLVPELEKARRDAWGEQCRKKGEWERAEGMKIRRINAVRPLTGQSDTHRARSAQGGRLGLAWGGMF